VVHFDLYRLADPEELEYLGYRDYLNPQTLCLIEWPQRAAAYLQATDLEIELEYDPEGRRTANRLGPSVGLPARTAGFFVIPKVCFRKQLYLINKYRKTVDF
jgi:hypothetical protein